MINMNIGKHAVAFPAKVASGTGAGHLFDIELASDTDNGAIIGVGDYIALGTYKEAPAPAFKGVIREVAGNGHFYVEVTENTDAVFVYMPEVSPYNDAKTRVPSAFYNAKGETVKGYSLIKHDMIEESVENFDGTPVVGAEITGIKNKKLVVATA